MMSGVDRGRLGMRYWRRRLLLLLLLLLPNQLHLLHQTLILVPEAVVFAPTRVQIVTGQSQLLVRVLSVLRRRLQHFDVFRGWRSG